MKIGIAGPISRESIARYLDNDVAELPVGYAGAPLLGTLIGALLQRGHSITAYTTSTDLPVSKCITASGHRFKISFCGQRPRAFRYGAGYWGRAADFFKFERIALGRAMQEDAPDLIHAHWTYEFALAAMASGLPYLVTCHDVPQVVLRYSPNLYRLSRYFMARRVLSHATHLTAVSPYLQQALQGQARAPIAVVPNPVPAHPPQLAASTRQYDPAHPRLAMVLNGWGNLKNPRPALRAFAALRRTFPGAQLRIMGSGYGAGGQAESWAMARGLTDGVHFLGPQPYPVLLGNLAESDLLLHPALEETFGMSIAEAMSLGVPVVGGQASGAVPWVIGAGGMVTDVTSPVAIERALSSLLSDPIAYRRCAQMARARVAENFGADRVAAAYESIYRGVLNGVRGQLEERLTA